MDSVVSIVIPVYNNEKFIGKCLESVIGQSYPHLQIIVVDDGSSDGSANVIEEYRRKDDRIEVLCQSNRGVSAARNAGIANAKGEYLTFVDGDDYIGENYICDLVECAIKKEAQMVITGICMVDTLGREQKSVIPKEYIRGKREEWTFRLAVVAAHLYKRELWDRYRIRFYVGERGEDIPVALFFAAVCDAIAVLPKNDYYYVQHEQSAMHNFKGLKNISLPYHALEESIQKIREVGIKNSAQFHELFLLRIMASFIQLAKGADKKELHKLAEYIRHILDTYYPNYYKNRLARIFSKLDIPISQKIVVKILIYAARFRMINGLLKVACR